MNSQERLDKYLSIVPTTVQKRAQRENFNVFFHYGLNTFTGKEWGDGKVDPKEFNPSEQDTDQWVKTAKDAGAYGVILTCKHHDGFCLWPTATTDYSGVISVQRRKWRRCRRSFEKLSKIRNETRHISFPLG